MKPRSAIRASLILSAITCLGVLAKPVAHAESMEKPLALSTIMLPPLGSSPGKPGFLEQVAREAFRRLGVQIEVDTTPGKRSLINANTGLTDGELMRTAGFEKLYPNLIQVPEKISDMDFVAYTTRDDIQGPLTWSSLPAYSITYPTGWKIFDREVKAEAITKVRSIEDLFVMLDKGRADLALADRWEGLYLTHEYARPARIIEPPLATAPMYIYLNRKHAELVPRLAKSLAAMKADGTYKKIFDSVLLPIEQHKRNQ